MKLSPSPVVGAIFLVVAWCLLGASPASAAAQEQPPSYLTSIYQVSPSNGRRFLIGTGAIVHSSDRALIVLGSDEIDFWGGDRVSLSKQDEEMTVQYVYEDFGPPLLVLSPLRNPSAVRPIDIDVDRISPGDKFAVVGFEKGSDKARQYSVSTLAPRDCTALPHVRSSSFVFDQSANICVDNAKSVGSAFDGDASGGPLLVKRGKNGHDYLAGISSPDAPGGVFENMAKHAGWVRYALGQILNPPEEAY